MPITAGHFHLNWAIVTETMQTINACSHLTAEQVNERATVDYVLTAHRITNFSFSSKDCQGFVLICTLNVRENGFLLRAPMRPMAPCSTESLSAFWGAPHNRVSTASAIKDALATSQPAESDRLRHGTLTDTYQCLMGKIASHGLQGRVRVVVRIS